MAIITKQILEEIGIDISEAEYQALSDHVDSTLNQRVVAELAAFLTTEQVEQLQALETTGDDNDVQQWLSDNVPDFEDIVSDEVDILLGEIAESSQALSSQS